VAGLFGRKMPTYAVYGGWVISIIAGWFEVTADNEAKASSVKQLRASVSRPSNYDRVDLILSRQSCLEQSLMNNDLEKLHPTVRPRVCAYEHYRVRTGRDLTMMLRLLVEEELSTP
jgi:hypothetical protein